MNTNGRSRVADLKVVGLIVSITLALGTAAWGIVSWAQSMKPRVEAQLDHEGLHHRISKVDDKVEENKNQTKTLEQTIKPMAKDIKTMKCIMVAPTRKAREKCILQE